MPTSNGDLDGNRPEQIWKMIREILMYVLSEKSETASGYKVYIFSK